MSVHLGVHPGGRGKFALCGLFWPGHTPATVFEVRALSSVDAVRDFILGICGEWGQIDTVAIDAPLSWSGRPSGWRECDLQLKQSLPDSAPRNLVRPPNSMIGATAIQGVALICALQRESNSGVIASHTVVETNARFSLLQLAEGNGLTAAYRQGSQSQRISAVEKIAGQLESSGLVSLDSKPRTGEELEGLVASLAALGCAIGNAGLTVNRLDAGEIQPVGNTPVVVLASQHLL